MEIIDCKQLSQEWFEHCLGSIGGSSISSVMAKGKGKMRKNLLYRLAGEILSGIPYESYSNYHMERGVELEKDAVDNYFAVTGNEVESVGLVRESEHKHYSPDSWINPNGILEIKCPIPSVHIEVVLQNKIPPEYRKQCQWGLFICQCDYVDFVSYSPNVYEKPIWIIRSGRDEELIKEMNAECDKFISELEDLVKKIREK